MGRSASWPNGSTREWRKVRKQVLEDAVHRCELQLDGCTGKATDAHHTVAREVAGDDPSKMIGVCHRCNVKAGDPRTAPDPEPRGRTQW